MPWWRRLLALLGLTDDARVRIRAPGIEVVMTGRPDLVRAVLSVVKAEIERAHRIKKMEKLGIRLPENAGGPGASAGAGAPAAPQGGARHGYPAHTRGPGTESASQIVLPSELDDMDSPYAIPEHRTMEHDESTPVEPVDSPIPPSRSNAVGSARRNDVPASEATADDAPGFGPEDTAPGNPAQMRGSEPPVAQPIVGLPPDLETADRETPAAVPAMPSQAGPRKAIYDVGTTDPDLRAARVPSLKRPENSGRGQAVSPRSVSSSSPWRSEYDPPANALAEPAPRPPRGASLSGKEPGGNSGT